jgi:hypothetical protein
MTTEAPWKDSVARPGRNELGHFARGNPGGPGAKNQRRQYELRKTLLEATNPDDLKRAWDKMMELACDGDINAAKLIFSYALGAPAQRIELDRRSEEHIDIDLDAALTALGWTKTVSAVGVKVAGALGRPGE